jgi:hypothetical protein
VAAFVDARAMRYGATMVPSDGVEVEVVAKC